MQSTDNPQDSKGLFALFKGESGSGKSVAALSFPKPHILDLDKKMPAIAQKHYNGKKFDWETFEDAYQIGAHFNWMKSEDKFPYETVIVDTLTSLSGVILKTVDTNKGQDIYTMMKNIHPTKGGGKHVEFRSYDSYNAEDMFLKSCIDELKFLWSRPGNPRHVIVCAHILSHESIQKTQVRRLVTAGKAIAAYIPAQFDEVYHFVAESGIEADSKSKRMIYTDAVGDNNAKTAYRIPISFDVSNQNFYDRLSEFVDIGKGPEFVTDKVENYL